jgi:hypothetical protein
MKIKMRMLVICLIGTITTFEFGLETNYRV